MLYLEKYNGYIADNPNIEFERCDGTVYAYDEVNTASMTNNKNMLTITGGQGNFPLAYIDTDSTLEFSFESSLFDMGMFEMSNAVNTVEGDYGTMESKRYDVDDTLKITIPFECKTGSVKIRGMEEATAAAAGKFSVAITAATASADGKTVITFNTGDVVEGQTVRVAYIRRVVGAGKMVVKTTSTSAKGSLYAHWPVYSDGSSCADAAIKGWLHLYLPRVRVSTMPGFSNSYKQASTNGLTFSAMDPKRADKKMFELVYEPTDAEGNIVAKSGETVDWN